MQNIKNNSNFIANFNTVVVKKYKLADQDQFNQKVAYRGPALALRDINSIYSRLQGKPNLNL